MIANKFDFKSNLLITISENYLFQNVDKKNLSNNKHNIIIYS